jgi:hypothetical protein
LENIRHTNTIEHVMKNGRLYDASNLDEIHPNARKAPERIWFTPEPEGIPGIKK